MKILVPIAVTEPMLVDSTLPETEHAAWSSGATYALADRVIYDHKVYESLQAGNTNKLPSTQTDWWALVGPSNRWAMFDEKTSTASSAASSSMSVTLQPGVWATDLALVGLVGTSARVQVYEPDGTTLVYERTQTLPGIAGSSYYAWLFERSIVVAGSVVFSGLPRRRNGRIVVTVFGPGSVALGVLALGTTHEVGQTQGGASTDIVDYSRVQFDEFGDVSITRRKRSKRISYQVQLANSDLPRVLALREALSSVMCVFIGVDNVANIQDALLAYGLFTRFPVEIDGPVISTYSLEVQSA